MAEITSTSSILLLYLFYLFVFSLLSSFFTSKYYRPPSRNGLVIVTGCTVGGMGETIAVEIAKKGFHVLAGVRKEAYGEELVRLHPEVKDKLLPVIVDVGRDESVESFANEIESKYIKKLGLPLVGVVNNAGIGYPMPIELCDMNTCRDVFNVNVLGIIRMTKYFTKFLRQSSSSIDSSGGGAGRIINIGSATGTLAMQCDGPYAASKFAGEGLSDAMRLELMKWKISVSLIVVGQIKTSMWKKLTGENAPSNKVTNTPSSQGKDTKNSKSKKDEKKDEKEEKEKAIATALYGDLFNQVEKAVGSFQGKLSPPTVVAAAVIDGLISPYPRSRYVVANISGIPVFILRNLVSLLPDRVVDFIKLNL